MKEHHHGRQEQAENVEVVIPFYVGILHSFLFAGPLAVPSLLALSCMLSVVPLTFRPDSSAASRFASYMPTPSHQSVRKIQAPQPAPSGQFRRYSSSSSRAFTSPFPSVTGCFPFSRTLCRFPSIRAPYSTINP